ncbi:hypothetical protein D3C86_2065030 [compost metagenome]
MRGKYGSVSTLLIYLLILRVVNDIVDLRDTLSYIIVSVLAVLYRSIAGTFQSQDIFQKPATYDLTPDEDIQAVSSPPANM